MRSAVEDLPLAPTGSAFQQRVWQALMKIPRGETRSYAEIASEIGAPRAARAVARDWRLGRLAFAFDVPMPDEPGRPAEPELLPPNRMPRRGRGQSLRGRIALYHALAHIEFTAIDLALDMAGRFGAEMGPGFVSDFLAVAADEAMHFVLLG